MAADRDFMLLVTRNLPPLVGGMERLMQHTAEGLAEVTDLAVIGPSGCRQYLPAQAQVVELDPRPAIFLPLALLHAVGICWRRRPRCVLGGSGLLGPVLLLLQWLCQVRAAVFLHGLDIVVDNRVYQSLFVPCFRRLHTVLTNSRNTADLAVAAGVPRDRIEVIHPGTGLPEVERELAAARFRKRHAIEARHVLLFVGRVTPRKGLRGFLEHSLPGLLEAEPDSCVVVVGEHPDQGLATRSPELEAVNAVAQRLQLNNALHFLGQVDDEQLQDAFAAADVLVFPLVPTPGDIEGFGMVAIEAAALGTPTVAFAVGGVVDAVAEGVSGHLVESGNYAGFTAALLDVLRHPGALTDSSRRFAEGFAWPRYHRQVSRALALAAAD